ncbi:hypothetical protein KAW18_11540 [candidate division WOR-3 bacterium]|nr:hypothetical protein [candidate division WOR-3 bacterium]
MTKTDYTRDELITLCERALVAKGKWMDRDTYDSQVGIATTWMLLKTGHDFIIMTDGSCATDDYTIWVRFYGICDFSSFEGGEANDELFYIPTQSRLDDADGYDWY